MPMIPSASQIMRWPNRRGFCESLDAMVAGSLTVRVTAGHGYPAQITLVGICGDFWVFGYGSLMWRPGFAMSKHKGHGSFGYRRRSA